MATRTTKPRVPTTIRAESRGAKLTAVDVAVGLLTGAQVPGSGWAKAQTVSWRVPVQTLAQIDVLAEAANISRSRAALTIMNAGWMQILAALPDRAARERFQAAMELAAEKRLRSRRTSEISF